jgi:asparagine synthase (glutamine-hydrolysing)
MDKARQLRGLIVDQVSASPANGILFSGGLDTSILAAIASSQGRRMRALMVSVAEGNGLDEPFARSMADRLEMELEILRPRLGGLLDRMPELISLLETFDPMELRNSIVAFVALESAGQRGISSVMTGDAADELFAGYNFMFNLSREALPPYINHLNGIMHFTSQAIGRNLGVVVSSPYLGPEVRSFALSLAYEELVRDEDGSKMGKKILREAFSDLLPPEITWRVKTPIEYGSGSTALKQLTEQSVPDAEFEQAREHAAHHDSVKLRDKEQYFYYRIYRRIFAPPGERARGEKTCHACQGPLPRADMNFCRICGAYPI